jgi:hypothetical protein
VKAAEASAIRKLRHPRTGMKLKKYLNMWFLSTFKLNYNIIKEKEIRI